MGILAVINPAFSARKIYQHFVHDLNLRNIDFLLPDLNHDTFKKHREQTKLEVQDYGKFLCELFDCWTEDDNPKIGIRFFLEIMKLLAGKKFAHLSGIGPALPEDVLPIITIYYNGKLSPDDSFITTDESITNTGADIYNISLKDFINLPIFNYLKDVRKYPPKNCTKCVWLKICNGGATINRYSQKDNFERPSIYCEALKMLYSHIVTYMINHGLDIDKIPKAIRGIL